MIWILEERLKRKASLKMEGTMDRGKSIGTNLALVQGGFKHEGKDG